MPQQSLLEDTMGTMEISLRPPDHMEGREHLEILVSVGYKRRPPSTILATQFVGIETDYLDTFLAAVVMTWAYGERPSDVRKAGTDVMRLARKHRRAHEF